MTEEIKTHRELHGTDPRPGVYEWDAGNTPPAVIPGGRWTVRLTTDGRWQVIFHRFASPVDLHPPPFPDAVLADFGWGEEAERAAKAHALALLGCDPWAE